MQESTAQTYSITTTPTPSAISPPSKSLIINAVIYGGVAVAVIIAMTYFSNILLKRIKDLLNGDDKG